MYWLFVYSLYQDLDNQLVVLANSATLSLGKLKKHPRVDIDDHIAWKISIPVT